MVLRIFTDELVAFLILILVIVSGWLKFSGLGVFFFILAAVIFAILYIFAFLSIKVFASSILMNSGRYEDCLRYSKRAVEGKLSAIKLLKNSKLVNYYKIFSAYACIKLDQIAKASQFIEGMDEEGVLRGQLIQLRMIKAFLLINAAQFKKALDLLTSVKTGSLSEKLIPELFYLISFCYLELGIEFKRAMTYAAVAYGVRGHDQDYKINYAVALYKCNKDILRAKNLLGEIYKDISDLSSLGKPRLVYYLYVINKELGNKEGENEFKDILEKQFQDSAYVQKELA